jgi:hypothetical protein
MGILDVLVKYYAEILWIGWVAIAALVVAIVLLSVPPPRNRRRHTIGRRLVQSGQLRRMP